MKLRLLVMAVLIAMVLPAGLFALDVDWDASYDATGFLQGEDLTDADTQGIYQSIRIAPSFEFARGVTLHTSLRLYEDFWRGDHRAAPGAQGTDWTEPARLGLDYGYVGVPLFGGELRVGRQEANWGPGLTTSDDRRDRIAYQYDLDDVLGGPLSLLAIYDVRQSLDISEFDDKGQLLAAAAVGYHLPTDTLWGLLGGYFLGDADQPLADEPFLLDDVAVVGPFVEGQIGPVSLDVAAHTIFPIANDRDTFGDFNDDGLIGGFDNDFGLADGEEFVVGFPSNAANAYSGESGGLWNTFNAAAMLRTGIDFEAFTALMAGQLVVETQGLFVYNGGLVEPGFDTFSSMINNDSHNTVNPVNVFNMGGSGYEDDHQLLGAARVNYELFPGVNLITAGGVYHFFEYERDIDNNWTLGLDPGTNPDLVLEDVTVREARTDFFVDVGLEYAVTEQATLFGNYGWLGDDTSGMFDATGEHEEGDPVHQFSAGVRVSY